VITATATLTATMAVVAKSSLVLLSISGVEHGMGG
jgi:hypothetical protein